MGLLSQRLFAAASLVPEGAVLADVGTDHAFLPIALIREGRIQKAYALDVNQGPLDIAASHIREAGLEGKIIPRLSDGFSALRKGEADTAAVLGMGGGLILRLIREGDPTALGIKQLILGPQSEQETLRRFLLETAYTIKEELLIEEEGHVYPILFVKPGKEARPYDRTELAFGRQPLDRRDPVLRRFLEKRECVLQEILEKLSAADNGAKRKEEIEAELSLVREAMVHEQGG